MYFWFIHYEGVKYEMKRVFSIDDDDSRKTIPDREKLELKEEFMTIMQERFLSGHDKNFDYRLASPHKFILFNPFHAG